MMEGEICKDLLLQVYDNVLTIQEYFAIRQAIDSEEEDFRKFVQQTVIAFSEKLTENEAMERKVLQMPAPSMTVILERVAGECTSECIPKDLQRKYLFRNEKYFARLLGCITESGEGPEEREWAFGAQVILRLLRRGSLFTWLPGPNFVQRTGKSIDHVITARQFLPQPIHRPLQHDPAADDRSHSRLPVRRRKRKTKDLSSAVIHQKSFMYNSCPQSESSFRRIFENMSGASFVENEFLLPHQIHLISGQESLRELMQQVMQKHNHFFSPRFSVQKICPVHIENKTDVSELVRKYTSHLDVCHLLRITLFTIFPFKLFGTKKQRRKFYRSLCLLVTSAFTVRLQYKNLIRGILLDNVRWLSLLATREDRRQAFGAFTNWTVNYFIGLLRGFFYATETQFGKFEIFFYQKHVWRGICKYSTTIGLSLTTGTGRFEKTRLIPKKSSVRMICPDQMLTGADTETEIREQGALVSILQMLRSDPRPFIFDNFSEFCETVRAIPHGNLFMVKADIRDCYPCIKQAVLSDIIRKKVACVFGRNNSGTIICQEVRSVILSSGSLKVKTHYVPIPHRKEEQMDDFTDEQEFGFTSLRNRILAPSAVIAVQEPLNKIISQFRGNVIKQGSNFYLLSEGIRQGGRLSPELCHLYMESFLCSMFRDAKKLHIALKADDILIASSDKEEAETALQRIVDGSHKFNFRANREKIFTNFESKSCVQVHSRIPFCGSFYDCDTRSVMADFTRFQTSHLKYSFNCNPFHKAMAMAKYVANQFSHMRFHLMDSRHNDADVVVRNFYERFLFQGMRFACFLLCSDSHKQSQDAKLLEHFANLLAHKAYKLYHCGSLRQGPGCSLLSEREVHFICSSAILRLWEMDGNLRKRKGEKQALRVIRETKRRQIASVKIDRWSKSFSQYSTNFPQILIK